MAGQQQEGLKRMKKALNFDLDTNQYERVTGKLASTAYYEIRHFLETHDFEHRQGSGYVSKTSLKDTDVNILINEMSLTIGWQKDCVRQFDVTNVGKHYSVLDTIMSAQQAIKMPEIAKDVEPIRDINPFDEPDICDDD